MRIIFLPVLLFVFVMPAQSQVVFGLKAGFNRSTVSNIDDHLIRAYDWRDGESSGKTGFSGGVLLRYKPFKAMPVFVQPELNYVSKGYRYSIFEIRDPQYTVTQNYYSIPGGGTYAVTTLDYCAECDGEKVEVGFFQTSMNYIEVPLLIGIDFKRTVEGYGIQPVFGPFVGYWIRGRVDTEEMGADSYRYAFSKVDKREEVGIIIGATVSRLIKKGEIFVSANASFGLTEVRNTEYLTYDKTAFFNPNHNKSLQLNIGYIFGKLDN